MSDKTSKKLETKTFEKFGSTYSMGIITETRALWQPVHRLPDGTVVDTTTTDWVKNLPAGVKPFADWIETDKTLSASYVDWVRYSDDEIKDAPIELFGTLDGPLLGIVIDNDPDELRLLDPCVVRSDDIKGTVHLLPIFNVARTLRLKVSAIRSVQAPAEAIIAIYPGFVIQNKMFKYQLKPRVSVVQSEPLDNTGIDVNA